ncbi:hypothetical protein MTO96_035333 [Rhipicephalus appendiculatus]
MYRSCINRGNEDVSRSVEDVRAFLRDRHVNWPEHPGLDIEPLDLFLEFAIKWALPLWLRVRLMRYREKRPREVSMDPVARPPPFLDMRDADIFGNEWLHYMSILSTEPSNITDPQKSSSTTPNAEDIPNTSDSNEYALPAWHWWLNYKLEGILNKHFEVIYPLVDTDLLLTSDVSYLDRSLDIFKVFEKAELLDALGWWFVLSSGIHIPHGENFDNFDGLECVIQVEDIYKLLLAAEWDTKLFSSAMMKTAQHLVSTIAKSVVNEFHQNPVTKLNDSVSMAKLPPHMLEKLAVKLTPASKYTMEPKLEDIYWRFPEGSQQSYTHQWLYARRNASGLVIKNVYDELSRLPHFYYEHPITYDLPHNTIAMPATAFMEPLYFTDGTDAMLYGALGSTLAMEVLNVVSCDRGKSAEGCGYPAVFNLAAAPRYVCEEDSASLRRPQQMALQVAHSAYVNASRASSDMKLQNLSDYSTLQIFFLVWCYTRCFDRTFRSDVAVCDDAVTDMPAFREAFRCGSARAK